MKTTSKTITCPFCDKQFISIIKDFSTGPLIKNEKIRKVVRWWADYNGDKEVIYYTEADGTSKLMSYRFEIDFFNEAEKLKDGEHYTIDELCGEDN